MLEGGRKPLKIGLEIGVTIGGDADKIGNNTHLLVVMRVMLWQKMGLLDLTTRWRWRPDKPHVVKFYPKCIGII